jgi:putative acetyltransferase
VVVAPAVERRHSWLRENAAGSPKGEQLGLEIRSEQPGDEDAIDVVNFRAFSLERRGIEGGMPEVDLVRRLRRDAPSFERRFSVTAWEGGQCLGHALFLPARARLLGQDVQALQVAPVAVLPERQRQGIGGQLLRFGHDLGREQGYQVAFLTGVITYYPRHGYVPAFGFAKAEIDAGRLPAPRQAFRRLPVQAGDLPWLERVGAREWGDVDFGCIWGADRREWTLEGISTLMWWTEDGRRAAYTVSLGNGEARQWRLLLAEDADLALDVLASVRPSRLDHHPSGWLATRVLDPAWSRCSVEPSLAAMAIELEPGLLEPYLEKVRLGQRPCGAWNWPLPYMLC